MWQRIALVFLIVLPLHFGSSATTGPSAHRGLRLEDYLPAIAAVESSNRQYARSWRGAEYGRGLYGVSEICYQHFKEKHPTNWAVMQNLGPESLYNTNLNRDVAEWYLRWLMKYYAKKGSSMMVYVLSAYNQGPTETDRGGLAPEYVEAVMAYFRK